MCLQCVDYAVSPQDEKERGGKREGMHCHRCKNCWLSERTLYFALSTGRSFWLLFAAGGRPHRIGNCRVRGNNPCCYCGEGKAAQSWSYWGRKNRRNKEEIIRSILLLVCLICFRIISEWCTPDFCVLGLDRGMLQARSGSLRPRIKEWCYAEELCTKLHL